MEDNVGIIVIKRYRPIHSSNRMSNEGNTAEARRLYIEGKNKNLRFLLENRYSWMNNYIDVKSNVSNSVQEPGSPKSLLIVMILKYLIFQMILG
jgi:hypothetical protein